MRILYCFFLLFSGMHQVLSSGSITFKMLDFQIYSNDAKWNCCRLGGNDNNCSCQLKFRLCIGVNTQYFIFSNRYRECSLINYDTSVNVSHFKNNFFLRIPFTVRWPKQNVSVAIDLENEENGLKISSTTITILSPLSEKAVHQSDQDEIKKLEYEIGIECDYSYFGLGCSMFCPIGAEHRFFCSRSGEQICKNGWSGATCDDPVCEPPCLNGHCVSPNTCRCRRGWRGQSCEKCDVLVGCKHGYCTKPNECICHRNWGGIYCDSDLDYCYHHSPCENGGTCSSGGLQNFYYCNCTNGFTGRNCEYKKTLCADLNCGIHGRCFHTPKKGPQCFCDHNYHGERCQYHDEELVTRDIGRIGASSNGSCKLSASEYILNGFTWSTVDCRQCICQQGLIRCSGKKCEARNCFSNDNGLVSVIECPKNQHCDVVTKGQCLSEICSFPRGHCIPWEIINGNVSLHKCQKSSRNIETQKRNPECSQLLLELDSKLLSAGIAVDDICFHLILEVVAINVPYVGFICERTDDRPIIVIKVHIIPINFVNNVVVIKDYLMYKLNLPKSHSRILNAVKRVVDMSDHNIHTSSLFDLRNLFGADGSILERFISVIVITSFILLFIIFLRYWKIIDSFPFKIWKDSVYCAQNTKNSEKRKAFLSKNALHTEKCQDIPMKIFNEDNRSINSTNQDMLLTDESEKGNENNKEDLCKVSENNHRKFPPDDTQEKKNNQNKRFLSRSIYNTYFGKSKRISQTDVTV